MRIVKELMKIWPNEVCNILYICCYLVGTQDYSLIYKGETGLGISAYTDSDWTSNLEDQRSQTGYFLTIADGAFSWISRAQRTIALSLTETEYMALSDYN